MSDVIFNSDFFLYQEKVIDVSPWWNITIIIPIFVIYLFVKASLKSKDSILFKLFTYGALCLIIIILTVFFYPLKKKYGEYYKSVIDVKNNRLLAVIENDTCINSPLYDIHHLTYETKENSEKEITHYNLYAWLYNGLNLHVGTLSNKNFKKFTDWNDKYFKRKFEKDKLIVICNLFNNSHENKKSSLRKKNMDENYHKHYEWEIKIDKYIWLTMMLLIPFWLLLFAHFLKRKDVYYENSFRFWMGFFVILSINCALLYYIVLNYKSKYLIDIYQDKLVTHLSSYLINHNQSDTIYFQKISHIYMDARQQQGLGIHIYLHQNNSILDKIPSILKVEGLTYKERFELYHELLKHF